MCGTRPRLTLTTVAALCLLGGCSQRPEFSEREEITELIPEARTYAREQLANRFGSVTAPVAWEQLPLHFHAATASITDDPGRREFAIDITEQSLPIQPGDELLWYSGELRNQLAGVVREYDEESRTVTLVDRLGAQPVEGDRIALGPGKLLQHGRLLYAEHCQHCHGVSGDGDGPTAKYLNPLPRDYRNGTFKFTSTITGRRARREDLSRTIEDGIAGTYMPSFKLLEQDEMTAIVEYVLWLSMRGEAEGKLATLLGEYSTVDLPERAEQQLADQLQKLAEYQAALDDMRTNSASAADIETVEEALDIINHNIEVAQADAADPNRLALRPFVSQFDYLLQDTAADLDAIVSDWNNAYDDSALVVPKSPRTPSDPESIARGRLVFLNPNAKCAGCHGDAGLGNGDQTRAVQQGQTEPGLFDEWGHPIQPRNLTTGIYRGGRRPLDIYRRIHSGIKGTPMPGSSTSLTEEQIWDLVNYVLSIPFEERELGAGAEVAGETPPAEDVAANQPTPPSIADN